MFIKNQQWGINSSLDDFGHRLDAHMPPWHYGLLYPRAGTQLKEMEMKWAVRNAGPHAASTFVFVSAQLPSSANQNIFRLQFQ